MPHVTIEYSNNLDRLAPGTAAALVEALHAAALEHGGAPLAGLRTRAVARSEYRVADGHADNVFVAITARLGAGREHAVKRQFLETITEAAQSVLDPLNLRTALSAELIEINMDYRINDNKIRAYLQDDGGG